MESHVSLGTPAFNLDTDCIFEQNLSILLNHSYLLCFASHCTVGLDDKNSISFE